MNYKIQIDGLRFFAIISVMIGHWIAWDAYNPIVKNVPWGHGVILFFVISGYLITEILLNEKYKLDNKKTTFGKSLKVFYIRRFFRIFPIYYLLIFFLFLIGYPKTRELFWWLVTYTSNIREGLTNEYVGNFNHFWSLAVEEQFYIIWPLLILLIPKKNLLKLFVGGIIVSFCSRLYCHYSFEGNWMMAAYFTPNLFLPLILGAILAYLKREKSSFYYTFFKPIYAHIGLIIYGVLFYYFSFLKGSYFYRGVLDEYLFAIACALYVANASLGNFWGTSKFALENKFSNYIGRISYGVYLYHLFIPDLFWGYVSKLTEFHPESKKIVWLTYFLLCFAVAALSFLIVEKPINKLKNRFKY